MEQRKKYPLKSIDKMQPKIEKLTQKKLLGRSMRMSLAKNGTHQLWQGFMPLQKSLQNTVGTDFYSLQVYDRLFDFDTFTQDTSFTKWAAIEVSDFNAKPKKLKPFVVPSGLYAVFLHEGPMRTFHETLRFIFKQWLPNATYVLDDRPHFERLGKNYKNNAPDSQEEIWIPILPKKV